MEPWKMSRVEYCQYVITNLSIPWWKEAEHYIPKREVGTDNYYDALVDGYCKHLGYVPMNKPC